MHRFIMNNNVFRFILYFCISNVIFNVLFIIYNYFNVLEQQNLYAELAENGQITTATYKHNGAKGFPDTPTRIMIYYSDNGQEFSKSYKCSYEDFQTNFKNKIDTIIVSRKNHLNFEFLKDYRKPQISQFKHFVLFLPISLFLSLILAPIFYKIVLKKHRNVS